MYLNLLSHCFKLLMQEIILHEHETFKQTQKYLMNKILKMIHSKAKIQNELTKDITCS